jgi:hypothetical protein
MAIVTEIGEWSLLAFGTLLLLVLLIAHEVGYWIGLRHKARSDSRSESAAIVVGGDPRPSRFCVGTDTVFCQQPFQ